MRTGELEIAETYLDGSARIRCPAELIPRPGQYLLADLRGADSPLAFPLFPAESAPEGFRCAPVIPPEWTPGARLSARGALGRGFEIPPAARSVALLAYDDSPARLRGLLAPAFQQSAEVVLLCHSPVGDLPEAVEVQPLKALTDVLRWADYLAADCARENFPQLRALFSGVNLPKSQILLRAPMPCGGLAECGACAITVGHGWKMICKDGPVFDWETLR